MKSDFDARCNGLAPTWKTCVAKDLATRLLAALEEARPSTTEGDRLVIKSAGKVVFLKLDEIDWVEAAANYVNIHAGQESYYMRETMNSFSRVSILRASFAFTGPPS